MLSKSPYASPIAAFCQMAAVILLLGLAANLAFGNDRIVRWRWSNPAPHGGNIYDMATSGNLAVQVAERGQIYTSENLEFWEPRDSHTSLDLRSVTFLGDRILISGERGIILYADSIFEFQHVDLQTENWLEGLAASSTMAVAVGDRGAIYSSPNGADWTERKVPFTNWLRGVTYGADTFVAVGMQGLVMTSDDGIAWTRQDSGTDTHLNRVKFIENQFWISGDGGLALTSTNRGMDWTPHATQAVGDLWDAAGNMNSQLLVGDHEVLLRSDSSKWADQIRDAPEFRAPSWPYYNAMWDGSFYFLSGKSGMMVEGFQTNATSPYVWVHRIRSIRNWLWETHRAPNFFITVGAQGTIMSSSDGISWDLELPPDGARDKVLVSVTGTTNQLVVVGEKGTILVSTNRIENVILTNVTGVITTNWVSALGVRWEQVESPAIDRDLHAVTTWRGQFFAAGGFGTLLRSKNALDWERLECRTTNHLWGIAGAPPCIVAVGENRTLVRSEDGDTWSRLDARLPSPMFRVRYTKDRFVAVGGDGTAMTSDDGLDWKRHNTGFSQWLNDVMEIDGVWYFVGNQGMVLTTSDFETWTNLHVITRKSLLGMAYHHGRLVVTGVEGAILRTDLSTPDRPPQFGRFDRSQDQNLFLLRGFPGQRFNLQSTSDFGQWHDGPTFEFLDNSGTIIILTPKVWPAPNYEFYRAQLSN